LFLDLDNNDLQLLIGGTGKKSYLDKINDKFKIDKKSNIQFLDYVNNKKDFFSKIQLFVFPSYSEGLGLVLLEAMSYSKICITRNVSPMNTILNSEVGFLFNNQRDFKEKIESAIDMIKNDKTTADKKLLSQYNLLNEKYSMEVLFKKIESIYIDG
jgi:glycosyltransferase involved in cell wall biosynthesis